MRFQFQQFFRALILASFAALFLKLHFTGEISKYINPKYELLSQVAAIVFLFFFIVQLTRVWTSKHDDHEHCHAGCDHDHGVSRSPPKQMIGYAIIIFPLITGFFLPAKVLDSSIAAKKGTMLPMASKQQDKESNSTIIDDQQPDQDGNLNEEDFDENLLQDDQAVLPNNNFISQDEYDSRMNKLQSMEVIEMKDDIYNSYYEAISMEPEKYVGTKIKVKGFVYKEEGFETNQLVVSRFLVTHCIADASIVGFLTEFNEADKYGLDTWIEVEGTLSTTLYNGVEIPMIKAVKVVEIPEPKEPYLFPVLTNPLE